MSLPSIQWAAKNIVNGWQSLLVIGLALHLAWLTFPLLTPAPPSSPGRCHGSQVSLPSPLILSLQTLHFQPEWAQPRMSLPPPETRTSAFCCAPSHPIPRSKSFPGSQSRSVLGPEPDYISVQVRGLLWVFPGLNFPVSHQVREYDDLPTFSSWCLLQEQGDKEAPLYYRGHLGLQRRFTSKKAWIKGELDQSRGHPIEFRQGCHPAGTRNSEQSFNEPGALSLLPSAPLCTRHTLFSSCFSLFPVHMVKNGWRLSCLHSSPNTKTWRGDHSVFQSWVKKLPGWLAQLDLDMFPWVKVASSLYQNTALAVTVWKPEGKGKFLEKRVLEAQSKKCPPDPPIVARFDKLSSWESSPPGSASATWTLVLVKCSFVGASSAPVGTLSSSSWRAGTGLEFFVSHTAYPVPAFGKCTK